ncbi:hypothetical protein THRCLA_05991, partial [Thraustotheca clavata]
IQDAVALVKQNFPELDAVDSVVDTATLEMIQAIFLHAMETCDGKLILEDITSGKIGALLALERKVLFGVVAKDIHRKASIVALYFVWMSSWPWIGSGVFLLFLFSNMTPCVKLRNASCNGLDVFFIHDSDPLQVEWQFHSYLTALLLLYLSQGSNITAYIIIAIMLAIPYGVSALKKFAKGLEDQTALDKILYGLSFFNKLILVYYCWSSYSSLIMVAVLFFHSAALSIASISILGVGVGIELATQLVQRFIPPQYLDAFATWKSKSKWNSFFVAILPVILGLLTIWWTWEWTSLFGGFIRLMTVLIMTQVIPASLLAVFAQLAFLAIALPLQLIQTILQWLGVKSVPTTTFNEPNPTASEEETNANENEN